MPSNHSIAVPDGATVAVVGPEHSFSDQTLTLLLGEQRERVRVILARSMAEIQNLVAAGEAYGLLPYVNFSSGHEADNRNFIAWTPGCAICADVTKRIAMCLGGTVPPALDADGYPEMPGVRHVHSKNVGIAQCCQFLRKRCPGAQLHDEDSTSKAAEIVAGLKDPTRVALASKAAILKHGLHVWNSERGVSNAELHGHHNATQFLLVRSNGEEEVVLDPARERHSIIVTPENRRGVSRDILGIIAEEGFDLSSQPEIPVGEGTYRFFYLMRRDMPQANILALVARLRSEIHPLNGDFPLVDPRGSWDPSVRDPELSQSLQAVA